MKNRSKILYAVVFLFFLLTLNKVSAQVNSDTTRYQIITKNGNKYTGKILGSDSAHVKIRTLELGEITMLKKNIKTIENVTGINQHRELQSGNHPQNTRYFFSPNGYGLKKNQGYYQNVWVMVNNFAYGLSDNFSIGGGLVPMFLFAGSPTPVWVTAKMSFPLEKNKLNMGVGALMGTVLTSEEGSHGFGMLFGLATVGSKQKNVSLGIGYGYAGGHWANSPLVNFNAMVQIGKKGYFITENYLVIIDRDAMVIISAGGRQMINRVGIDYGLIIPLTSDMGSFVGMPWLGLTIPIGYPHSIRPNGLK
jgi:hypothetical protein